MGNTRKTELYRKFEQLYSEYSGRIFNFVLKMSHGDVYLAEEITQITFQRLWEKLDEISESEMLSSYLFTTARNTLFNVNQHEAIEYVYLNYILKTSTIDDCSTEETIDHVFLLDYLNRLIKEMPPVRQRVFRMSRMQYKSHKQIADELSISVNSVETHIALALKFIKERLSRRYGTFMLPWALLINIFI